jgi:hypothetical protein
LPLGQDSLRIQWRKLLLNLIRELEIQGIFAPGVPLVQNCNRLAAIVIAVMKEEHDLAANFSLQPARGRDLGVEKSLRKKAARLLPETDDRLAHGECSLLASWAALGKDGALRRCLFSAKSARSYQPGASAQDSCDASSPRRVSDRMMNTL